MALTKCSECGNQVSTEAFACPQCGAPRRQALKYSPEVPPLPTSSSLSPDKKAMPEKRKRFRYIIGSLIIASIVIEVIVWETKSSKSFRTASASHTLLQSSADEEAKQPTRWELIQKLIRAGVFIKVEQPAEFPHVYVGATFYNLTFDEKEQFINVIWAYYKTKNPAADLVVLKDGYTGKEIGKYAEVYGGLKMK